MSGPRQRQDRPARRAQSASVLVTCLVLLAAVMLAALGAANLAGQGEKLARAERENQLAFLAAEAALADAEQDVLRALRADAGQQARSLYQTYPADCGAGDDHPLLGLCLSLAGGQAAWLRLDLTNVVANSAPTVAYGRFTGRAHEVITPAPRYLIEALPLQRPGQPADGGQRAWTLRITAIGFATIGAPVVLQSYFTPPP